MRMFACGCVAVTLFVCAPIAEAQHLISTTAGGGPDDLPALAGGINQPTALAADGSGRIFIATQFGNRVFRVDHGLLEVVAGNGLSGAFEGLGEPAADATLSPQGMTVDPAGNIFISASSRVLRVNAETGVLSLVAGTGVFGFSGDDGPATAAQVGNGNLQYDPAGAILLADRSFNRVRRIDLQSGIITTIAGNGVNGTAGDSGLATSAAIAAPSDVELDAAGNLFITTANRVRRVDVSTGIITTVAGTGTFGFSGDDGPATAARLGAPTGIAFDSFGNMFIADSQNRRVREVDTAGVITTFAGTGEFGFDGDDGPAIAAALNDPVFVLATPDALLVSDSINMRVRRIDWATTLITTLAGTGVPTASADGQPATRVSLGSVNGVALDSGGNLYIAEGTANRVRRVDAATGIITTVAGNGTTGPIVDGGPATLSAVPSPVNVAVDAAGNLFISSSQRVRRVDAITGVITTFAGNGTVGFAGDNGPATSAQLNQPDGLAVDSLGNLYIADTNNSRVRKVDASTGLISLYAGGGSTGGPLGDGGPAVGSGLAFPQGLSIDAGDNLFIADFSHSRIRRVDAATQIITTVAGTVSGYSGDGGPAVNARMKRPTGVFADAWGNLFIADPENFVVRRVDAAGTISTWAGDGVGEFSGDNGPALQASLVLDRNLAATATGDLYVADTGARRVRTVANRPPVVEAGADQVLECASPAGTIATLSARTSDPDDDPLTSIWSEAGTALGTGDTVTPVLTLGEHAIALETRDGLGGVATDTIQVSVRDTVPPSVNDLALTLPKPGKDCTTTVTTASCVQSADVCSSVTLGPIERVVLVNAAAVMDARKITLHPDAVDFSDNVKTETDGNDRHYVIYFTASDASGNTSRAQCRVTFTHVKAPSCKP